MQKKQRDRKEPMLFTPGNDWHLDIFLEANAQITDISLKVYSQEFPNNVYNIAWNLIRQEGIQTQIPIDAAKIGHSNANEKVHLHYEITYYI